MGMCGGIVSTYSLCMERAGAGRGQGVAAQLLYNVGRLATYTGLGVVAGLLGQSLTGFGHWQGVARGLAFVAGIVMIVIGLGYLGLFPKLLAREAGGLSASFKKLAALMTRPGPFMGLPIGLGMGFLPCGLVYAMLIKAAGTGSAVEGGLVMLSFGLGTVPALLLVGTSFQKLSQKLRGGALKAAAVAVILVGIFTIWRGFAPTHDHSGHMQQPARTEQPADSAPPASMDHSGHADHSRHEGHSPSGEHQHNP